MFKITWFKHAAYLEHSLPLFSDVYKHVQASTRSLIIFIIFFFAQKVIFVQTLRKKEAQTHTKLSQMTILHLENCMYNKHVCALYVLKRF